MQDLAIKILRHIKTAGAGKAHVVLNDERDQPIMFVLGCVEHNLTKILLPLIEKAVADYNSQEEDQCVGP